MDLKSKELKWEGHFISRQEELYVFVLRKPICMTPNAKAKAVPMESWWVHNPAGPEASLDWQMSRVSLCALGQNASAQDHIHVSEGIKWESPNFTCSWPCPSLQCLSYRLVTLYCLEMIMIKFHLTISSFNCCGHLEIWMQKIEIGPLFYTK